MKYIFVFLFLSTGFLFSQQKQFYVSDLIYSNINFLTDNLDDIVIENTASSKLEIILENDNLFPIVVVSEVKDGELIVSFKKGDSSNFTSEVFSKYITKRLERARVVVKVPQEKNITVYGENVGVTSNNYNGDINVYINRGNVQLNNVVHSAKVHLFLCNVQAVISNIELNITSKKGNIIVDNERMKSPYIKENITSSKKFIVNSIHANVTISSN